MENIFFPSKSSFAVFVWLTLALVSVLSVGSADKSYTTLTNTVDHSLTRLLNIQNSLLPQVTETLALVVKIVEPISLMKLANADETAVDEVVDTPYPPSSESTPKVIPKNDLQCMAENIYYEAGSQSYAGKLAVGQVVINRTKLPSYPRTICGVIYEGNQTVCQFSWTCSKRNAISRNSDNWMQSLRAATDLLGRKEKMVDIVEGATSFHATSVKPSWAKRLRFIAQIDGHLFYAAR